MNPPRYLLVVWKAPLRIGLRGPTSRMAQPFGFGQIRLAAPQVLLGTFAFRHIHGCADECNHLSSRIANRMFDLVDMLYAPVRYDEPIVFYALDLLANCVLETYAESRTIFRVHELKELFMIQRIAPLRI